jgi:hypothetical protein
MKTILFALILAAATAEARIGETIAQCHERYGNPLRITGDERRYETGGFVIFVTFFEGKAEEITYCKQSSGFLGRPDALSKNEIAELLKKNAVGVWKAPAKPSLEIDWESADGSCVAGYSGISNVLRITTTTRIKRMADARQAEAKAKKAEENRKLKGL